MAKETRGNGRAVMQVAPDSGWGHTNRAVLRATAHVLLSVTYRVCFHEQTLNHTREQTE
jgi:hypothetical protein